MAKSSKKKSAIEPITVSEIYERIQAKDFLRELWWDLISDIQEKPTYKRLKAMVDDVMNNSMMTLTSKKGNDNEELKRRATLTEISIMTYTLDTVISEVLYRRYQNEYEDIAKNLIKDILKNKGKEDSSPVQNDLVFENIEKIINKEKPRSTGKKENDHKVVVANKSPISNSLEEEESAVPPVRKRGRPKKINRDEEKPKKVEVVPKKKRGRPSLNAEKRIKSFDDKTKHEVLLQESGAESDMSIGNMSLDSVSSVHTSELSSFEDTISICSDEGKKKRIPLKVANEMYLRGKLSQIYHIGKRSEKFKMIKDASTFNLTDVNKTKDSSSGNTDSGSRKVLPQRIRKPNSKYSSDTMYCEVKDYSSPPPDSGSSSSQDEPFKSPKIQRRRKRSSLDKATTSSPASKISAFHNASSTQNSSASKRVKTNNSSLLKPSTKRYDTSDLYKPRAVTGSSFGSRSTAVFSA